MRKRHRKRPRPNLPAFRCRQRSSDRSRFAFPSSQPAARSTKTPAENTLAPNRPTFRRQKPRFLPASPSLPRCARPKRRSRLRAHKKIAGWSHHSPPNGGSSVSTTAGIVGASAKLGINDLTSPPRTGCNTHASGQRAGENPARRACSVASAKFAIVFNMLLAHSARRSDARHVLTRTAYRAT